eukprot:3076470-Rhodomonas_salina.4
MRQENYQHETQSEIRWGERRGKRVRGIGSKALRGGAYWRHRSSRLAHGDANELLAFSSVKPK